MLRIFRNNHFLNSLLILPYILVIRHVAFTIDISDAPLDTVGIWSINIFYLAEWHWQLAIDILIFIQALLINRIVIVNRLHMTVSLWPGIVYVLLVTLIPQSFILCSEMVGVTFLLLSIGQLFRAFKRERSESSIFNAGFFGGALFLTDLTWIWIFPLLWAGLALLRKIRGVEFFQLLIGFITPIFLVVVFLFYNDDVQFLPLRWKEVIGFPGLMGKVSQIELIIYIFFILLLLISVFSVGRLTTKLSGQARKKISVVYLIFIICGFCTLLKDVSSGTIFIYFTFPLAIIISRLLLQIEKNVITEALHVIMIVIIWSMYYTYF